MIIPFGTFFDDVSANVVAGIVVAILFGAAGWFARRSFVPWVRAAMKRWSVRFQGERWLGEVELSLSYQTHLRDVMQSFRRALDDPTGVRERIRRDILEPVRAFIPTGPSDHIKVVWFRPTEEGKDLHMYEQVGHTEEGQALMRLPIGSGVAGRAFIDKQAIYIADCQADQTFQPVEKSKAYGSLACVPIMRGTEATGVLSVLCTRKGFFWVTDIRYFEALAAAIGALEVLESAEERPSLGSE